MLKNTRAELQAVQGATRHHNARNAPDEAGRARPSPQCAATLIRRPLPGTGPGCANAPRCPRQAQARQAQARRAFLPPPSAGAGVSHGAKGTDPSQTVVAEPPRRVRCSSAASMSTSAAMPSMSGGVRGSTHGSCLVRVWGR